MTPSFNDWVSFLLYKCGKNNLEDIMFKDFKTVELLESIDKKLSQLLALQKAKRIKNEEDK